MALLTSFEYPENKSAEDSNPIIFAADTHNIANNGESFWDGIADIPKFIGLGIASGVNQVYNIVPTIGNWFGGSYEQNNLADTLAGFDSDLARYYEAHQEGTDALGFVLSSLVPGTAGVKMLRAGQKSLQFAAETGVIGGNLSKATGLLAPSAPKHVLAATKELISGSSPFSLQNANVLRTLRAGAHQSVLEGAAFEVAVAATMHNSPILENQDIGDITSNILWGAGLFGVIGGAIEGVKNVGKIKKSLGAFDTEASPWTHIETGKDLASPSERILLLNEQRLSMPSVVPGVEHADKLKQLGDKKLTTLNDMIRKEFSLLAQGDERVADMLYGTFLKLDNKQAVDNLWELNQVLRTGTRSTGEKLMAKVFKGKADLKLGTEALEYDTAYLNLRGANAGKVQDEVPAVSYIADMAKKGATIALTPQGVLVGKKLVQAVNPKTFDIMAASHLETEARLAWARKYFFPKEDTVIDIEDIPMMDVAYEKLASNGIQPLLKSGDITFFASSPEEFLQILTKSKVDIATKLAKKRKLPQDVIAKMVNVKSSYLSGEHSSNQLDDLFADLSDIAAHNARTGENVTTLLDVPSSLKLSYKKARVVGLDGNWLHGMEAIKRQQRLYENDALRTASIVLGEDAAKLIPITQEEMTKATRLGAGASFVTFASGNYGSLGSKFEYLGKVVTDIINNKKAATREVLEPLLYKLQNDQTAAIEWSTLMQTVRGSEHVFKLSDDGTKLVLADEKMIMRLMEAGDDVPEIALKSPIVQTLAKAHVELNGARVENINTLRASQGLQSNKRPDTFYAPPPNPKDYPFFAFVIDPTITGTGHSRMLYAASEAELKTQMAAVKAQFPEFKVLEKGAAESYYKSIGQFDYEKTLNENYIDTALKRKGVSAPFLIKTDPAQIVDEFLQWHLGAEAGVVRESVSHVYESQFDALRKLGEQYTLAATSKYGGASLTKYAESSVENPYTDYIKVALGINKAHEYPFWMPVQKMLDNKFSQLWGAVKQAATDIKSSEDLQKINNILQESGYKGAYYDAALNSAVNSKIPRGALTQYVQESNAVLSLFALRLDPLNALNNVIGSNVLLNTEIRSLLRNIESRNVDAAGELAQLMKLKVPGTDKEILNHGRLIANAIKNFHSRELKDFYKTHKFTTDIRTQYLSSLDTMAIRETDTVSSLANKRAQLVELGKKWAGRGEKLSANTLAEEFNRFVAADVMRQITDVAVKHGVIDDRTALAYINTFVNRTQGNFLAAQRPMMFQGPIGQAIGLFQTYQFNLLQQLFRHVAEGSKKDTAILLGLQGSIYGMNGLPAFNAINTHIVGTASGNTQHKDIYTAVYGGAGKDAGDWLMYGLASNMFLHPDLKVNMYVRGDINPRHVTVVPTNPADVPFINAQVKFFGNMFETFKKLGDNGNTASVFLQGLEHNGISRPLAGLAQTMQAFANPEELVYSTSKKGNIVGSNDLYSLMTLGRLLGGKPLDEAITQDAAYRVTAYSTHQSNKIASLGEVVKSTMIAGQMPDQEQVNSFMEQYVAAGGKQENFNKFMIRQMKNATKSQAEQMREALTKPYSKTLQEIMGGYDPTPQPLME